MEKEQVLKQEKEEKKFDYRHIVSILLTFGVIALGVFVFPNAIARLGEALRDLGLSLVYYCNKANIIDYEVTITVTELPKWQIAESKFHPLTLLPFTWEEFKVLWAQYWQTFASKETFVNYLYFLADALYYITQFLTIFVIPMWGVLYVAFKSYLQQHNNNTGVDSRSVRILKRIADFTYRPVKKWISEYIRFLRENVRYVKTWLLLFAFYFNFFTIITEFFAFYFYFIWDFHLVDIYRQVYKLLLDLSTVVRFLPGVVWAVVIIGVMEYMAHQVGYNELNHRERRNRGFWNERGIVTAIYANMGGGKTEQMTDGGLSCEVELRDRAFDIIVECDFCFPYFPWAKLERELKIATIFHVTYDLSSIRRWIRKKYNRWIKNMCPDTIFGYDYERYGLYHNDALKIENVWQCLEDYACAYFVYAVQCSLIISNYSVRSDVDCIDFGNFPKWNTDFFHRSPELMAAYSRRSHILDFDMLRFGKRVLKDNPNRHALGFGVYLITEIDKERKNNLENKALDANAEEANQKNDKFNPLLKMIRHACMIRNRVFIILLCDLQRPEDWGAGGREVGDLIAIDEQSDERPVLPFWAPFWTFEAVFLWLFKPFVDLYYNYRVMRADNTVPVYYTHGFLAKIKDVYERTCNTFGSIRVTVYVESGRMDGQREKKYLYKNIKKSRMERYGTDCLQGMFEQYAKDNTVGIMDLDEYADKLAQQEELRKQHSYMQDENYAAQLAA